MKIPLIHKITASIIIVIFTFTSCHVSGPSDTEPSIPPGYYDPVPEDVKFMLLDANYKVTDTDIGILAMIVENSEYTKDVVLIAEIRDNDISNNRVVRVQNTENNSMASFFYDNGMSFPDSMIITTGEENIEGSFGFYDNSTEKYSITFFDNNTGESETLRDITLNKSAFSLHEENVSWTETQNLRLQAMHTTLAVWVSLTMALDAMDEGDGLVARSLKSFWQKIKQPLGYIIGTVGLLAMLAGSLCSNPIIFLAGAFAFTIGFVLAKEDPENLISTKRLDASSASFTMGSNDPADVGAQPAHQVNVKSFRIGKYPVTQEQYKKVMGINPSYFTTGAAAGETQEKRPVEMVTWYDAVEFCNKASLEADLEPVYTISARTPASGYPITSATVSVNWSKNGFRLPTEAEWEYACRAGTTTPFSTGNNITTSQANYDGNYPYNNNAKGEYREGTTPVGSFAGNSWGLHDMHGNVWEWCWDWYGDYAKGAQTNPRGAVSGDKRVLRGVSWDNYGGNLRSLLRYSVGRDLRSAYRGYCIPDGRSDIVGFRLVRL